MPRATPTSNRPLVKVFPATPIAAEARQTLGDSGLQIFAKQVDVLADEIGQTALGRVIAAAMFDRPVATDEVALFWGEGPRMAPEIEIGRAPSPNFMARAFR